MATKQAEKDQSQAIKMSMAAQVDIINPFDTEVSSIIEAPGRVLAIDNAQVIARVPGMLLKQHFTDGQMVKKGDLLFTIDPTEYKIGYEKAKANLDSAKAKQYQAQKDFERAAELVKNDFISKSTYDQALATKDAANAGVKGAIAALNDAKRLLSYTTITAPIAGKISYPIVTEGNYLSSPNTVLTKIIGFDPIYVTYSVDSSLFNQLRNDEIIPNGKEKEPIKVQVTLPSGEIYEEMGQADFFDNNISQTTGSITLRGIFKNPKGILIPGDFVSVKVFSNKVLTRLAVPQASVLQDVQGKYLYTVDENNIAHRKNIVVDGQKGDNWLVVSGVTKEDKIISTGIIKVRDNLPVIVRNKAEQKEAAPEVKEEVKEETPEVANEEVKEETKEEIKE